MDSGQGVKVIRQVQGRIRRTPSRFRASSKTTMGSAAVNGHAHLCQKIQEKNSTQLVAVNGQGVFRTLAKVWKDSDKLQGRLRIVNGKRGR
jgi:hypothetical protein